MFNGENNTFYVLECKTFQSSCSFEREKGEKGMIHFHQIESLKKFNQYKGVVSGFILDFRDSDKTYFLSIDDFLILENSISKKSFNEKDMLTYCSPTLIEKRKLKVNYRYNIEKFMTEMFRQD